ncbi:MAG: response regulator [Tannerellaceae bacterium]|nr:response regulator [Tannerellaceae bacterium]
MEMLVGNLLSNSFKHTMPGGKTSLHVYLNKGHLVVDVFNIGPVLSDEEKVVIFQPYIRTHSFNNYMNSGIGLAIVQSISNLLDIKLSVQGVENEGNIFRAEIPVITDDNLQTTSTDIRTDIVERIVDNTMYYDEQHYAGNEDTDGKQMFQILLVENDRDTRKVLKKKLQDLYHVLVAANGKEALLLMKSQHVDIVVSDIRMGEMDGFELCRSIKENSQTNHIPVLLITSDLSTESKIQGFRSGADAFLQKPINIQELKLRLDNILKNKHVLRSYYANFNQLEVEEKEVNNADEIFLREFTTYIYEHLNDVNLSVIQLAQAMNMSRTQLYLMVKRLADQTPSAFVLSIKMKRARKLLLTTDMTSSEISYQLGYCNPNHFSRQFKEYFHESPTEFRKNHKEDKGL